MITSLKIIKGRLKARERSLENKKINTCVNISKHSPQEKLEINCDLSSF